MLRKYLPKFMLTRLFGDRDKFGLKIQHTDPDWAKWEKVYLDFYNGTQKSGIGAIVNDAGYTVLKKINMSGKKILELGPGDMNHIKYWSGKPSFYAIADTQQSMLDRSSRKLESFGILHKSYLLSKDSIELPFAHEEFDIIVSFYVLEHLYNLKLYLEEMKRVLKNGGYMIGAIPCEGGLAWGLGRFLTSRRWLLKNFGLNLDKIICWEHPNFADEILSELTSVFSLQKLQYWPSYIACIDSSLIVKYLFQKTPEC